MYLPPIQRSTDGVILVVTNKTTLEEIAKFLGSEEAAKNYASCILTGEK